MDPLSILIFSVVIYTGAFYHGYSSVDIPKVKRIEFTVPPEYTRPYRVQDCIEGDNIMCPIPTPRYVVSKDNYINLTSYVKGQRIYLQTCEEVIENFNKDPYIEE